MLYRRFRTGSGALLDALIITDGPAFAADGATQAADIAKGYACGALTVVEGPVDPWDGVSVLLKGPPAPTPPSAPPTAKEKAMATLLTAIATAPAFATDPATRAALANLAIVLQEP